MSKCQVKFHGVCLFFQNSIGRLFDTNFDTVFHHQLLIFVCFFISISNMHIYLFRCENIMTCPMREIGSGSIHCPYDWLAVYDGRDEHAPLIGKFCGVGKFPFSIIGK